MRRLTCHGCKTVLVEAAVGSRIRNDVAAYCGRCHSALLAASEHAETRTPPPPEFIKTLFGTLRK